MKHLKKHIRNPHVFKFVEISDLHPGKKTIQKRVDRKLKQKGWRT